MNPGAAIARYAERFHRAAGSDHHVASPLGAWLLLALVAPAATGRARQELADTLGCDIDAADGFARDLLATPHPAVALAAAAWSRVPEPPADLTGWLRSLEPVAGVGPMPSQAVADQWTRDKTAGLIDEFPLKVDDLLLVLASALATRISWTRPFSPFDTARLALAPDEDFGRVERLLVDESGALVETPVGLVGVHTKWSREHDLAVVSVIADRSVAAADVLRVAHPLARAAARQQRLPGQVAPAELPMGAGHSWTVRDYESPGPGAPIDHVSVLPTWSATSEFDLLSDPRYGCGPALDTILRWASGPPEAVQVALARYTRTGFEAAAVTAFAVGLSAHAGGTVRQAQLEFTHPYAVVAVARGSGRWDGLPVFSAWVARADETPDETAAEPPAGDG